VLHLKLLSEPKGRRHPPDSERAKETVGPAVAIRLVQLEGGAAQTTRRLAHHRAVAASRVVLLSTDILVAMVRAADAEWIQWIVHQFLDVDHVEAGVGGDV